MMNVAHTTRAPSRTSFIWSSGVQTVAAGTTAQVAMGGWESRNKDANSRGRALAPVPNLAVSQLICQATGIYAITATLEFQLAAPIGAFPIVVSSKLFTPHSGPADTQAIALRAGLAGDDFTFKFAYHDEIYAGTEVFLKVTTGSTPIAIQPNNTMLIMTYLGSMGPTAGDI